MYYHFYFPNSRPCPSILQVYSPMHLWTQHARKGTKIGPSEFSKVLKIYIYLRAHVREPLEAVKTKYAQLRSNAQDWYAEEFGDGDGDSDGVFARAVDLCSHQQSL